jgi:hypothetical protein
MKARIKHTDIIIDAVREPLGWLWNSIQGKVYLDKEELEFFDSDDNIDWQSFRAEAAKDILCSIIQSGYYGEDRIAHQSELAVGYANELVKQLKEKEEK